jgi:effector-binding domain-containing protein
MSYVITTEELLEQSTAVVRGRVSAQALPKFLSTAFEETVAAMTAQQCFPAGPPFGRFEDTPEGWAVEAGFPSSAPVRAVDAVEPSSLPGGMVATTIHVGSYRTISLAYEALQAWLEPHGYRAVGAPWESYLERPGAAEPRTKVCLPCTRA